MTVVSLLNLDLLLDENWCDWLLKHRLVSCRAITKRFMIDWRVCNCLIECFWWKAFGDDIGILVRLLVCSNKVIERRDHIGFWNDRRVRVSLNVKAVKAIFWHYWFLWDHRRLLRRKNRTWACDDVFSPLISHWCHLIVQIIASRWHLCCLDSTTQGRQLFDFIAFNGILRSGWTIVRAHIWAEFQVW